MRMPRARRVRGARISDRAGEHLALFTGRTASAKTLIQQERRRFLLVSGGRLNRFDKMLKARRDDERRSSSLSARWHRTAPRSRGLNCPAQVRRMLRPRRRPSAAIQSSTAISESSNPAGKLGIGRGCATTICECAITAASASIVEYFIKRPSPHVWHAPAVPCGPALLGRALVP